MKPLSIAVRASVLAGVFLANFPLNINSASAQQRACVITDEGNTVCGRLTTQSKKPTTNGIQRKEVDKLVFVFKGCRRLDTTVKCTFTTTNKGEDRSVGISASWFTLVDSSGKTYMPQTLEIASGTSGQGQSHYPTLSTGIDYLTEVTFENIPEQIKQVPLLNIRPNDKVVKFRNISFLN
jgi:hypothetical protein